MKKRWLFLICSVFFYGSAQGELSILDLTKCANDNTITKTPDTKIFKCNGEEITQYNLTSIFDDYSKNVPEEAVDTEKWKTINNLLTKLGFLAPEAVASGNIEQKKTYIKNVSSSIKRWISPKYKKTGPNLKEEIAPPRAEELKKKKVDEKDIEKIKKFVSEIALADAINSAENAFTLLNKEGYDPQYCNSSVDLNKKVVEIAKTLKKEDSKLETLYKNAFEADSSDKSKNDFLVSIPAVSEIKCDSSKFDADKRNYTDTIYTLPQFRVLVATNKDLTTSMLNFLCSKDQLNKLAEETPYVQCVRGRVFEFLSFLQDTPYFTSDPSKSECLNTISKMKPELPKVKFNIQEETEVGLQFRAALGLGRNGTEKDNESEFIKQNYNMDVKRSILNAFRDATKGVTLNLESNTVNNPVPIKDFLDIVRSNLGKEGLKEDVINKFIGISKKVAENNWHFVPNGKESESFSFEPETINSSDCSKIYVKFQEISKYYNTLIITLNDAKRCANEEEKKMETTYKDLVKSDDAKKCESVLKDSFTTINEQIARINACIEKTKIDTTGPIPDLVKKCTPELEKKNTDYQTDLTKITKPCPKEDYVDKFIQMLAFYADGSDFMTNCINPADDAEKKKIEKIIAHITLLKNAKCPPVVEATHFGKIPSTAIFNNYASFFSNISGFGQDEDKGTTPVKATSSQTALPAQNPLIPTTLPVKENAGDITIALIPSTTQEEEAKKQSEKFMFDAIKYDIIKTNARNDTIEANIQKILDPNLKEEAKTIRIFELTRKCLNNEFPIAKDELLITQIKEINDPDLIYCVNYFYKNQKNNDALINAHKKYTLQCQKYLDKVLSNFSSSKIKSVQQELKNCQESRKKFQELLKQYPTPEIPNVFDSIIDI